MAKAPEGATFRVTYADGSTDTFWIDRHTLRSGDHVARIIAGERQREGKLRPGEIVSVSRTS